MCQRLDEDGGHIFLRCKAVKHVWRSLDNEDTRLLLCECASARQVTQQILSIALEKRSLAIILLWDCWRNKTNAGERTRSTVKSVSKSTRTWQNSSLTKCRLVNRSWRMKPGSSQRRISLRLILMQPAVRTHMKGHGDSLPGQMTGVLLQLVREI
uniref:Uncharacterized protein n=1 Tax=Avena sativa TaxID=4498 RepID=A0ACD5Y9W6_AVESA